MCDVTAVMSSVMLFIPLMFPSWEVGLFLPSRFSLLIQTKGGSGGAAAKNMYVFECVCVWVCVILLNAFIQSTSRYHKRVQSQSEPPRGKDPDCDYSSIISVTLHIRLVGCWMGQIITCGASNNQLFHTSTHTSVRHNQHFYFTSSQQNMFKLVRIKFKMWRLLNIILLGPKRFQIVNNTFGVWTGDLSYVTC